MISIGNLQINKLCLGDVEVTKAYLGDVQVYGSTPKPVGKYMTITVDDSPGHTTISPNVVGDIHPNLQYRINNGEWTDFVFGTTADIRALAGDSVQFKGVNVNGISRSTTNYLNFYISGSDVTLSGNVMSLIDGVGDITVIPNEYCFYNLFYQSYSIKTVSSDFLPATTLKDYCYRDMFNRCTSLATAPELPATTLAFYCYAYMFSLCKSLTTAPELPATTLAYACYSNMFAECTSLATAPVLPATTLAFYCYSNMFYKCTSLTTAPVLPATTLSGGCYRDMFKGCTSLTTAPELPATTLAGSCYGSMFRGCTSLTTAPALPATTISERCYESMFNGCTSLTTAPALPATTLYGGCYMDMFYGCTSLTTAPALPATTIDSRCYEGMFYGCTSLTTSPEILPATTLKNDCYSGMFSGCTSLVKAPELPATILDSNCYKSMFSGCTSLVKAPELPARTLASYCYSSMFQICKSLNYIKSLATDITATNALKDWLAGVAATGTFVKPTGVTYPSGDSGIPNGWTVVEEKYITMTVLDGEAGTTISPTINGTLTPPNLQYRVNNGSWNDFIFGTTADIQVVAGDWVQFKGVNESGISTSQNDYLNFAISGNPVSLSGNVMSLIDGVGDALVIPHDYCFYRLFHGSSIKTVSPDFLPATTITNGCYFDLFSGSPLENAPELPSLTMKDNCYRGMFYGCTSLTQAPALPATTLANGCYAFMLAECSSLVQVTALHATELVPDCYRGLFQNSTAITQAPALPATELAQGCYRQMFYGCSSLVNAPELPATTLVSNCYNTMFYNCTSLTKAPALPATTLANGCYQYMFYGDSSLNYVKSLATNINATNALTGWLGGVAASGTFVKPIGVSYPTGASGIPSGWTVVEEKPKPEGKYMTMTVLDGDAGTTIKPTVHGSLKPKLQYRINSNGDWTNFIVGTTANIHLVSGDWVQFKGVNESGISTSISNYLNFAISGNPVALSGNVMSLIDGVGDTLVIPNSYCFSKLFSDSAIKTVSSDFLPATKLAQSCYYDMFKGCTSLTTAPELPATKLAQSCYSYMFRDCTSLNYVKCLARNITVTDALKYWLSGVAQTGTFVKSYGVSYPSGDSGIPSGWTIQNI